MRHRATSNACGSTSAAPGFLCRSRSSRSVLHIGMPGLTLHTRADKRAAATRPFPAAGTRCTGDVLRLRAGHDDRRHNASSSAVLTNRIGRTIGMFE
jgi:hypothetical protein